jgi:hypothetical protein
MQNVKKKSVNNQAVELQEVAINFCVQTKLPRDGFGVGGLTANITTTEIFPYTGCVKIFDTQVFLTSHLIVALEFIFEKIAPFLTQLCI